MFIENFDQTSDKIFNFNIKLFLREQLGSYISKSSLSFNSLKPLK